MKRPLLVGIVLAALAAAGAMTWNIASRDRQYRRLIAAGDGALSAGQTLLAIESFSGAIALKPDSMLGYLRRGQTYRERGDLDAALRDLRKASVLDPSATRPSNSSGMPTTRKGNSDGPPIGTRRTCDSMIDRRACSTSWDWPGTRKGAARPRSPPCDERSN